MSAKGTANWLRGLGDEGLYELCEALDAEMARRSERRQPRGSVRSTYLADRVRGERRARRFDLPWAA